MQKTLSVSMFGAFSIGVEKEEDKRLRLSAGDRKPWSLLAYLITYRERNIAAGELIGRFGETDQEVSETIEEVRKILSGLDFEGKENLICEVGDGYRWNPTVVTKVDVSEFYRMISDAEERQVQDDRLALLEMALPAYKGDFLPELALESWTTSIRAYFRSLFIEKTLELTELLNAFGRWKETIAACRNALEFEPENEILTAMGIRALIADEQPEQAVMLYNDCCTVLREQVGVKPSEKLEKAYEEAMVKLDVLSETKLIQKTVKEDKFSGGAMKCDFPTFLSFVKRTARHYNRETVPSLLLYASLKEENGGELNARLLDKVLSECLRSSDIYTRVNSGKFMALAFSVGEENTRTVSERLFKSYARHFPYSKAELCCKWYILSNPDSDLEDKMIACYYNNATV